MAYGMYSLLAREYRGESSVTGMRIGWSWSAAVVIVGGSSCAAWRLLSEVVVVEMNRIYRFYPSYKMFSKKLFSGQNFNQGS